ncbi:MAG: trypsin-like peptidase domain-containing protein [Syntrophomonadaceae bacterium]|nr:trypsin-like peptidase domain-containing protein [Syntrophomonadaceae bacterium]
MEDIDIIPMDENENKSHTGDYVKSKNGKSKTKTITVIAFLMFAVLVTGFQLGLNNTDGLMSNTNTANLFEQKVNLVSDSTTVAQLNKQNSVTGIVEKTGSAVVTIETESQQAIWPGRNEVYGRLFGTTNPRQQTVQGLGSGFIITANGYLLTNYHVVEDADSIKVKLLGMEEGYTAELVGADAEQDLAVLKIDAGQELPVVNLGNSDSTSTGDWAIAIGNPYGLEHTVTLGVISAKGRPMTIEDHNFESLLQTDASINPGNSGGPLLNINGEVIGINTAVNSEGQGLGFAIPINTAKSVLQDLIAQGKMSTLE